MNQFWEETLSEGYYDVITVKGIKRNRGLNATWHNFTNLKVKHLINNKGKHLDYACGPGTLIGQYLNLESIGLDISKKQIKYASEKYKDKGIFLEIDKFNFNKNKKQFNTITVLGLLEFMNNSDIRSLLDKLFYLLADDGEIILTTPNFKFGMKSLIRIQNFIGEYSYKETHINKFNKSSLSKLLENTNFSSFQIDKYMNVGVFLGYFNLRLATKVQSILDYYFGKFFGFMLIIKLKK